MTRRPARCVLVALAVLATSCSGGDDEVADTTVASTPVTTPAPAPTTAPPTTAPPTTVPPTTTTPPATAPPTTAPPPQTAPPTTAPLDPIADLAAALQRDAQAGEDELLAVLADPDNPDAETRLRRYYGGTALESVLATLTEFRERDFVAAQNPDVPVTLLITGAPTLVEGSDPPQVVAETCRLDSAWVLVMSDQGILVPFNTTVYRTDASSNFVLVDGVWRLEGGELLDESEGATSCA